MDLDGNQGSFSPIISIVPHNLWERDILEDMGVILTTHDRVFFNDIMTHDKLGLLKCMPVLQQNTPNSRGHCPPRDHAKAIT